jgi:beta-ribofuranosylaminobenzene 5'-phosphate synthase
MSRLVRVTAASRLHFGLWSLGGAGGREFGGVGAMIEQPALQLSLHESDHFHARGSADRRTLEFALRWAQFHRRELPHCLIEIQKPIPEHAGLGSGTQLGLAIAAGLNAISDLPSQTPQELALSVGRGLRSAVGTYGFVFGGLIVEQGKSAQEPISPLDCRIDVPQSWRLVLVRPRSLRGLAGIDESEAFRLLPAITPQMTDQLIAEARDRLVPAAATGDFEQFAESVYHYGRLSGECFAARQGGPYNGPILTALVERIRGLGHVGVGQSSWGPTLFVAVSSQAAGESLAHELKRDDDDLEITVTPPANQGARIEVTEDGDGRTAQLRVTYQPHDS